MARLPAARLCEWQRVGSGALLPYHLGRLTTYAGLGALGGAASGRLPWFGFVSAGLLLLGAALFLAHVTRVLPVLDRAPAGWTARHCRGWRSARRRLSARRRTRLPALRLPLCGAGSHRGQRQPAARRARHAGLRARHHARAGGARHRRPGGGTALAARRRAAAPAVMLLNAALLTVLALRGFATDM